MADPELGKIIKQTQDVLGKYVKKPPLSEKNLSRPPFRFIHDIVTSVISGTGFLNGVFSPEELDPSNISTRESKTEFMKKLIAAVNDATGSDVPVKVSKILSGQEPEKTNLLLQALGTAVSTSGATATSTAKAAPKTKPTPTEQKSVSKTAAEKKNETKPGKSKAEVKAAPVKKASIPTGKTSTTKVADNKPKKSEAGVVGSRSSGGATAAGKQSSSETALGSNERRKSVTEIQNGEKDSSDTKGSNDTGKAVAGNSAVKRQNSLLMKGKGDDLVDNSSTKNSKSPEYITESNGTEHGFLIDSKISTTINPNMETLQLLSSPIMSDASAVMFGSLSEPGKKDIHEDVSHFSNSDAKKNGNAVVSSKEEIQPNSVKESEEYATMNDNSGAEGLSQFRPLTGTGSNRGTTARPPSARPAPPRPKSSLFRDTEESNYRPPTGKVTHVLLDSADAVDDDDNFVVREAAVAQSQELGDFDETPELALTAGSKFDTAEILDDLAPEQRGLLVDQILETQRELENRGDDKKKENDFGVGKSKETSKAEVEKLKNLLQECARHANPLGKLLDYVREDIDTMQKEVSKWREESRTLDAELEAAKQASEASIQPLQQQFTDLEARIADKEDAIAATKMSTLRLEERIEKILSGLDRVQSSHGKIQIPSATELLKNDSSSRIRKNSFEQDNSYSSGFGVALNRLAQTTPGMRPIFTSQAEDLDPDNFDPFK